MCHALCVTCHLLRSQLGVVLANYEPPLENPVELWELLAKLKFIEDSCRDNSDVYWL